MFVFLVSLRILQAPGYGDIRLSLEMIPDTVNLEEPFDIICKITNCRSKQLHCFDNISISFNDWVKIAFCVLNVVVKEPWTWCWRCATPGRSTGVVYQGDSWGNSVPLPSSLCLSRCSHPSRVFRYEPKLIVCDVFLFLCPEVLHLFVSEYFRVETQRRVSEEDVWIWWHCTSVCNLPIHK